MNNKNNKFKNCLNHILISLLMMNNNDVYVSNKIIK